MDLARNTFYLAIDTGKQPCFSNIILINNHEDPAMAHISIHRKHDLGLKDARVQVEKIAESLKEKLNSEYSWDGNTLNFKRTGASGTIDVSEDSFDLEITLGLALRPMKGMIEKTILENLDQAMDKGSNFDVD